MQSFLKLMCAALLLCGSMARAAGGDDDYSVRWTNGLSTEDLRFNALSANPQANPRMVLVPLSTAVYDLTTGDPVLREQLADPSARAFFGYLVSCALDDSQQVQWQDSQGQTYQWQGSLGLCPAWAHGPPSLQCQQWVSACLLARNNAEGKRVLLSARGNQNSRPASFTQQPRLRTDPYLPYSHALVASTQTCQVPEQGPFRGCGFHREYVGRCAPGQPVQLGAGGVPPSEPCGGAALGEILSGTAVLRVCSGLNGCDAATALAWSAGTCGTALPAVAFTCPASGTFSVLSAPYDSTQSASVRVEARNATYPASESWIFPVREGAFFGNLFGPGALAAGVDVHVASGVLHKVVTLVTGAIYPKMYACHDPNWAAAQAYFSRRLCAQPGINCAAQSLGPCNATVLSIGYVGPRCQSDNASGVGDYGQCMRPDGLFQSEVVTPYLHQPCDAVSDPNACLSSH